MIGIVPADAGKFRNAVPLKLSARRLAAWANGI